MTQNRKSHYTIGITGTIGSGKTAAAHIMESMGAYVINADIVAREVLLPGSEATRKIYELFGKEVMLGSTDIIDRHALAARVFSDDNARASLDAVTLPLIKQEMYAKAETARRVYGHRVVVFDAPLLIEAGLNTGLDDIWLIRCSFETKINRIMQRDRATYEQAAARIAARQSDEQFAEYATVIIDNDGSYGDFRDSIIKEYLGRYT